MFPPRPLTMKSLKTVVHGSTLDTEMKLCLSVLGCVDDTEKSHIPFGDAERSQGGGHRVAKSMGWPPLS